MNTPIFRGDYPCNAVVSLFVYRHQEMTDIIFSISLALFCIFFFIMNDIFSFYYRNGHPAIVVFMRIKTI